MTLYWWFLKKINSISWVKAAIFLIFSLTITCSTNSSLEKKEDQVKDQAVVGHSAEHGKVSRDDPKPNAAVRKIPKSSFTQQEMELFYNTVLGKKIINRDKVFLPVIENRRPVFIAKDIDNDGYTEFFTLFAESISEDEVSSISADSVKDVRNIFREEISLRHFLLAIYSYYESNNEKKFIHERSIVLEDKNVFSSLQTIEIDRNNRIYGISVNFNTRIGTHEDIITKARDSYSVTSIRNTLSDSTEKRDIDNDGVIDLLRYEKMFVDGLGVETFITWYKFNRGRFSPVRTVNTVQDLRSFFKESKSYLETKRVDRFVRTTVDPVVLSRLNVANISSERILERIFYPVKRESSYLVDINTMLASSENVSFIFPEIFEDPFRVNSDGIYSFTTYVRAFVRSGGVTISPANNNLDTGRVLVNEEIYLVKIYMAKNPFEANRFFFFVN